MFACKALCVAFSFGLSPPGADWLVGCVIGTKQEKGHVDPGSVKVREGSKQFNDVFFSFFNLLLDPSG